MKLLLTGLMFTLSISGFTATSNCQFGAGKYTNEINLNVTTGANPSLSVGGHTLGNCEEIAFTEELAEQVLEYKVSVVADYYGDEAAEMAREVYAEELEAAKGGVMVDCKDSPTSKVGVIVNADNSYLVMNGGSAYFDMTKGQCK
jgi:O-acetyl-ADP-ribose deacetylase (regulator of RNase III)